MNSKEGILERKILCQLRMMHKEFMLIWSITLD